MRDPAMVLVVLAAALGTACGGRRAVAASSRPSAAGAREVQPVSPPSRSPPAPDSPAATDPFPDTTGPALWAFLEGEKFRAWPMWPGKGRFFPGERPHGALLTVFVHPRVRDALLRGARTMPAHSIIVKENFGPDSALRAHTVMYKVPGYDPDHHDWFWGQYAPDGSVIAAGRVAMCWQCHEVAAVYDDLWILRDEEYLKRLEAAR